jgi:O-methyltransferase
MESTRNLYLDLLKKCLTNWIYGESEAKEYVPHGWFRRWFVQRLSARGLQLTFPNRWNPEERRVGHDWPRGAHTMIGLTGLSNLQMCVEQVLENKIPGDFIETGVWRGGASIFMRAVLKAHEVRDRKVWVADSFEGLPPPNPEKYPQDRGSDLHVFRELAIPLEEVRRNFEKYDLLDDQVCFLKGWFRDTLPKAPLERLALIRLDGDLYESTWDALEHLYPKLSPGGFIIVDDFGALECCREAVKDYRKKHGITEEIVTVDWARAYWRRSA